MTTNESTKPGGRTAAADYYRYLFECAGFAVLCTDLDGVIERVNSAAERLFRVSRAEMPGRDLATVFPEAQQADVRQAVTRAREQRQSTRLEIEDESSADQAPRRLAVVVAPVFDDAGDLVGLSAWGRDITNRRLLEQQLVEAEKMASLGTLASGVAHHFNNIIGGVATFVDYALQSESPQAAQRALKMTAEAANRIAHITESLLTFAEKDGREFDLSDLTEVLLTFSHMVEKPLKDKGIEFKVVMKPAPVYEVPGSRILQVLGNLLDNAERAMPDGGAITLTMQTANDWVEIIFADTGKGIPEEDLPHVFEPFFTTHGTVRGGDRQCAGLGLSVVHGVVHELGGEVDVSSTVGKGTTFRLRLPIARRLKEPQE